MRQTTTNFQLIMDNIPVVVSNSCLKKKKKIQELISDADKLPSMSLASEGTENQPKAKPNEEEDLLKEYLLHSRCDADCSRQVCIHVYLTHTSFFPIKLSRMRFCYSKICK